MQQPQPDHQDPRPSGGGPIRMNMRWRTHQHPPYGGLGMRVHHHIPLPMSTAPVWHPRPFTPSHQNTSSPNAFPPHSTHSEPDITPDMPQLECARRVHEHYGRSAERSYAQQQVERRQISSSPPTSTRTHEERGAMVPGPPYSLTGSRPIVRCNINYGPPRYGPPWCIGSACGPRGPFSGRFPLRNPNFNY